jgi:hypothetical protein
MSRLSLRVQSKRDERRVFLGACGSQNELPATARAVRVVFHNSADILRASHDISCGS